MEVKAMAHTSERGPIDWLEVVANGTTITLADAPGHALHVTVVGPGGAPIIDLTIRAGPSGDNCL